jgi:hypothetical protein
VFGFCQVPLLVDDGRDGGGCLHGRGGLQHGMSERQLENCVTNQRLPTPLIAHPENMKRENMKHEAVRRVRPADRSADSHWKEEVREADPTGLHNYRK